MWAIVATIVGAILLIAGVAVGGYAWNNTTYASRDGQRVQDSGYREAQTILIHHAEE